MLRSRKNGDNWMVIIRYTQEKSELSTSYPQNVDKIT